MFVADDTTVFRVDRSRCLAVLTDHFGLDADAGLDSLPEGRTLRLSSDFYSVYQAMGSMDGVDSLWCWAHIRRQFVKARDAHPRLRVWAEAWLEPIGALYLAHKALGAAEEGSDRHRLAAAQFAAALGGIDAERQCPVPARRPAPGRGQGPGHHRPRVGRPGPPPAVPRTIPGQQHRRTGAAHPGGRT